MKTHFGTTPGGKAVEAITLKAGDLQVTILTLGAILQDVRLKGVPYSLTIGSPDLAAYEEHMKYFGALVGPVANRIAGATAPLGDSILTFADDQSAPLLHGGPSGTYQDIWEIVDESDSGVTLQLDLPDGKGGFPGNRRITAKFEVIAPAQLRLDITGTTDALTLINIANHSYWTLDGRADTDGHVLQVAADSYTPVDAQLIPTGVQPVDGTDFDLRRGRALSPSDAQRLDHNYCLSGHEGEIKHACTLTGTSGVTMKMETTEIGLQVYDGEAAGSGPFLGHRGVTEGPFCGIALEAQRWPDAPNQKGFPSCELTPDDIYHQVTRWTFSD